jgi:hypothetical protein
VNSTVRWQESPEALGRPRVPAGHRSLGPRAVFGRGGRVAGSKPARSYRRQ